jgi:hypothetical protein
MDQDVQLNSHIQKCLCCLPNALKRPHLHLKGSILTFSFWLWTNSVDCSFSLLDPVGCNVDVSAGEAKSTSRLQTNPGGGFSDQNDLAIERVDSIVISDCRSTERRIDGKEWTTDSISIQGSLKSRARLIRAAMRPWPRWASSPRPARAAGSEESFTARVCNKERGKRK